MSDIHLSPLPRMTIRTLLSKRITGYLNWKLNRRGQLEDDTLEVLVDHMLDQHVDHIAITGDLVNLALDVELTNARFWLNKLGRPKDVSVLLGNHDAYVPGAAARAMKAWAPFLQGDIPDPDHPFPYLRQRQDIALIGLNSGVATPPFRATGVFDAAQEKRTAKLLQKAGDEGLFRVVMIHHPPFANATKHYKRLIGDQRFRDMVAEYGAELVLHGHTHITSYQRIEGQDQKIAVIGVPSASQAYTLPTNKKKYRQPARYNLFDIERTNTGWMCSMTEYGYSNQHNQIAALATHKVIDHGKTL